MSLRRGIATTALLTLLAVVLASAAQADLFQKDNLRISFDGNFTPQALPRTHLAPVTVSLDGAISTTDGTHPPALRRLEVALNSNGRLSTLGLPTCTSPLLQSTTTETALSRCRGALVGRGSFGADLESTDAPIPAHGTILAFNGRFRGKPGLLLHLYGTAPVRATFVLPLAIEHRQKGQLSTVLATDVPVLAGGLGSITDVKLKIGRTYTYRGHKRSFLSASCAAPAGFQSVSFPFARGSFVFANGTKIETPLSRDCRVR